MVRFAEGVKTEDIKKQIIHLEGIKHLKDKYGEEQKRLKEELQIRRGITPLSYRIRREMVMNSEQEFIYNAIKTTRNLHIDLKTYKWRLEQQEELNKKSEEKNG